MGERWRAEKRSYYPDLIWHDEPDGRQTKIAEVYWPDAAERIVAAVNRAAGDAEREAEIRELKLALWYAKIRLGICAARMRGCNDETGKHELLFEVENFEQEAADALKGWHPDPFFDKSTAPRADAEGQGES